MNAKETNITLVQRALNFEGILSYENKLTQLLK